MPQQVRVLLFLVHSLWLTTNLALAQVPTGELGGTVYDESEAVIPDARVTTTNRATGLSRSVVTRGDGRFTVPVLPPGTYEVTAEAEGFQTPAKTALVETGQTTTVDFTLPVGVLQQLVEAIESAPLIAHQKHSIDAVISRRQIEDLPLNGREFLQLAVLQPGVMTVPDAGFFTSQFDVSILGSPADQTRVTMDGSPIISPIIGGTPQNFSQEGVHEFQISTVNFDLATGLTGAGAVNVVTRSGGNDYHGSAFVFFRDHNLAAYPALQREPANVDPFFARRQAGFHIGGPLKGNRLFVFANFEHNNQDGVATVQPRASGLTGFGGIFPTDFTGNQISVRFDWRVNNKNSVFVRYSHDGNDGFNPPTSPGSLPSNWSKNSNWADQSVGSLITAINPSMINEFRFSYWYWHTRNSAPSASDCGANCIGLQQPQIGILGEDLVMGNHALVPQGGDFRRYHTVDNVTWQKGHHQLRFGFEWHLDRGSGFSQFAEPAAMVLYSPDVVRAYNANPAVPPQARIPLPASFDTFEDILQLPLLGFSTGFGDPCIPPPFNFDEGRTSHIWRFYWKDTWRVRPRLTVNFGLSYAYHADLANHDLSKPAYLEPLLGQQGLAPTRRDLNNFGPSLGFAWSITDDGKTVLRAGAGIYNALPLAIDRLQERSTIGPRGSGRFVVDGSIIPNPLPAVPGVPLFRPLGFRDGPTNFRAEHLMMVLPDIRSFLEQQLGDPDNTDLSVRNIEVFKQGSGLMARDFTAPYSQHLNVGIQRELVTDMVLSVDFAYKHHIHQNMGNIDFNRWSSVAGPVIRQCAGLELLELTAQCSSGRIGIQVSGGRSKYKGLLVRVDKRFSRGFQFLASYALSSATGLNGVINNNDWFESYGPLPNDRRHLLTVSGIVDLPWMFRFSFISTVSSRPPFTAQMAGLDLNGDGTINDLLPGTSWNELNRGVDEAEIVGIVDEFNRNFAGGRTPTGQLIPPVTLPAQFQFGDTLYSQDLRLSRTFSLSERYTLLILGEVFNVFNVANLSGYNFNLLEPESFGQPATRITQVFGSGGPRAFQLGARFNF